MSLCYSRVNVKLSLIYCNTLKVSWHSPTFLQYQTIYAVNGPCRTSQRAAWPAPRCSLHLTDMLSLLRTAVAL